MEVLGTVATARSLAAIVFLGFPEDAPVLTELMNLISRSDEELGGQVLAYQRAMWGLNSSGPSLSTVAEIAAVVEEVNKKTYKNHWRNLSEQFQSEGHVEHIYATDNNLKTVYLIFSDMHIAISHEKRGVDYIPLETVRGIVIGTRTERMHTGFTHTDYHKWSVAIYTTQGSIYEFTHLLGTNNEDLNPRRQSLTKAYRAVGDYYPVSSSGTHSSSESGYRSAMVYRF